LLKASVTLGPVIGQLELFKYVELTISPKESRHPVKLFSD